MVSLNEMRDIHVFLPAGEVSAQAILYIFIEIL